MTIDVTALFDAVRKIKGKGLLQSEVDSINRALGVITAAASREGMTTKRQAASSRERSAAS